MKVVLAGAQAKRALEDLEWAEAPNVLCSFEYLKKQRDRGTATMKRIRDNGMWQITDSGVFTWKVRFIHLNLYWYTKHWPPRINPQIIDTKLIKRLQSQTKDKSQWVQDILTLWGEGNEEVAGLNCPYNPETDWLQCREWAKDQLREYKDEYFHWLRDNAQYSNAVAELDCEWLIEDEIWEWREEMHEIVSQNSDAEIIMTPHLYKTEEDLRRIATMTRYLGCDDPSDKHPYWTELMPTLKELRLKVHGWAVTDNASIKKLPFYSVDSTTWLGGAKYGSTYHYVGNWEMSTLPYQNKQENRAKFSAFCKEWGIDFKKFVDDHIPTVNLFNAKQWTLYAIDLAKDTTRAYWLTEDELANEVADQRKENGMDLAIVDRRGANTGLSVAQSPAAMSARLCNTCFLASKCPAYQANSNCTVDMPLDIGDDPANFMKRMIEVQGQRVMFATFAERMQGGVIDPALTKEMDLLFKITKTAHEVSNTSTESVTITAKKSNGGTGIISQIFGGYGRSGGGGTKPSESEQIIDVSPLDDD